MACQLADVRYLRKNWGVLVALAIFYLIFGSSLLTMRLRRTKESYAYIK
jgi:hypothetical protein